MIEVADRINEVHRANRRFIYLVSVGVISLGIMAVKKLGIFGGGVKSMNSLEENMAEKDEINV